MAAARTASRACIDRPSRNSSGQVVPRAACRWPRRPEARPGPLHNDSSGLPDAVSHLAQY
eukprot:2114750-Alexandrium_andersonii.AAC.1